MACNNCNKTVVRCYNTSAQATTATGTTLNILGTEVVNTGSTTKATTTSYVMSKSGTYHVDGSVNFTTGTGTGSATVSILLNGLVLPETVRTITVDATTQYVLDTSTDIPITACCAIKPTISFVISGVDVTVNEFASGVRS